MAKGLNEVGAMWNKTNDRGDYFSISLDLDALAELTGGVIDGKVNLVAYPIDFEKTNPNAPDYRLKFFPRTDARQPSLPVPPVAPRPATRPAPAAPPRQPTRATYPPPPDDDDIPFAWVLPLLVPMALALAHAMTV